MTTPTEALRQDANPVAIHRPGGCFIGVLAAQ